MAREPSVTLADVEAAIARILGRGERVSNRTILAEVGRGSMTTIVELYNTYQQKASGTPQTPTVAIDDSVAKAIMQSTAKQIHQATAELKQHAADLHGDLTTLAEENARLLSEKEALEGQVESLQRDRAQLQRDLDQQRIDLERLQSELEKERQARQAAQVNLAKAELRLEILPTLQSDLESTRANLMRVSQEAAELRGRQSAYEELRNKT